MLGILYDTEEQDIRSQIDAKVCAVEALSVVSRLSQLTSGICGCPKPTGFRVTLKCYKTQQHASLRVWVPNVSCCQWMMTLNLGHYVSEFVFVCLT
jgi:hypothetical protein